MMHKRFSIAVGIMAGLFFVYYAARLGTGAYDFTYTWQAARMLASGQNPYTVLIVGGAGIADPFFYPLPAAIVALPFAAFPALFAGALWAGASVALLCYGVLTRARHLWPMLISAPLIVATIVGHWSVVMTAAALLPALAPILACKPTLGGALFLFRPRRATIVGGAILLALSFALIPSWPIGWLHALRAAGHSPPLFWLPAGPLLLLAALRLSDPRARLILLLALAPQLPMFADQLPLFLVCKTKTHALILALSSWLGLLSWWVFVRPTGGSPAPIVSMALSLPALLMALDAPALVQRQRQLIRARHRLRRNEHLDSQL